MGDWTKAAVLGAGLIGAVTISGCAADYYGDDYDAHRTYYSDHAYRDRDRDRDDHSRRVRVCDADDCHWEYERH